MSKLSDLINFIKISGDDTDGWGSDKWERELTKSLPDWREVVKNSLQDSNSCGSLEQARPKGKHYDSLCKILLSAGGLELAKRWFYSEVEAQSSTAKEWLAANIDLWKHFDQKIKKYILHNNHYHHHRSILKEMNKEIWNDLTYDMKDNFLEELFAHDESEPLQSIRSYIRAVEHFIHEFRYYYHDRRDSYPLDINYNLLPNGLPLTSYIPSSRIQKILFVIKDSKDKKYLSRIKEIILQRENACKNITFTTLQTQQRSLYRPNRDERELIARLMHIMKDSGGFLTASLPTIFISYEPPPIFILYPELEEEVYEERHRKMPDNDKDERREPRIPRDRERRIPETISIEEWLGCYQPKNEQILIYQRGIEWCVKKHNFDQEWLSAVVLIHEIGHWITHILPKHGIPAWQTDLYISGETDVHEGFAQLMTWWVAEQVGGDFKNTFEQLNQNQSSPYKVYEQFKNKPINDILNALVKLRLIQWPARLQDWKNALN